jgi:uncharacterized protein (TIGR00251 family)
MLAVRVTPRAKRSEIVGLTEGAGERAMLSIRLAAPPVDGAANDALCRFLADRLDLPRSCIRVESGASSRQKILRLSGDGGVIAERLRRLIA